MPRGIKNMAKASIGTKAYFLGGFIEEPSDDNLVYDSTTGLWSEGKRLSSARTGACAAALDGTIYITGGKVNKIGASINDLKSVESIKPEDGNTWVTLPDLNLGRNVYSYNLPNSNAWSWSNHGCAVFTLEGKKTLIVAGGDGEDPETPSSVEMLFVEEPGASWMKMAKLNSPRCCWPQVGLVDKTLAVVSGELRPSKTLEFFDQQTKTFTTASYDLTTRRVQLSGALIPNSFMSC